MTCTHAMTKQKKNDKVIRTEKDKYVERLAKRSDQIIREEDKKSL